MEESFVMMKARRNIYIIACKILNENDIYPLINFSWIMIAFTFIFSFLFSEVSANPKTYHSKYTLSLKGVRFSTEKSADSKDRYVGSREIRSTSIRDSGYSDEEMPNLREAYEGFDDYRQNLDKKGRLVCAKILSCLNPLLESSKEKLPIDPQKGKGRGKSGKFASESEEYYSLLRDRRFQSEILAVMELAKEGKSQENNRQAFSDDETQQSKRVTKTTRELLEKYESLRQSARQKYPRIVRNRLPLVEDF